MDNKPIEEGELVIHNGGLYRVKRVFFDKIWYVNIGNIVTHAKEVRKADWRDITRITKGGLK